MRYIIAALSICFICYYINEDLKTTQPVPCQNPSEYELAIGDTSQNMENHYDSTSSPVVYPDWIALIEQLNHELTSNNSNPAIFHFVYPVWRDGCN